ncbi:hypothetical protein CO731_01488 [Aminobacter sp. MSH1]|nr:hypothetical protein CO731_01488 [Aminobacter sp. MSH1]
MSTEQPPVDTGHKYPVGELNTTVLDEAPKVIKPVVQLVFGRMPGRAGGIGSIHVSRNLTGLSEMASDAKCLQSPDTRVRMAVL